MLYQDPSDLISVEELCDILAIGPNTAYELLITQKIEAFRIGRRWKIPRISVSNYIINSCKKQH